MATTEIKEIEGVWSSEQIRDIKMWMQGAEGLEELILTQNLAEEQSKKIQEIAYVDMKQLKEPFTFNF